MKDRDHQPVLLEEAIEALMVSADGAYVDGTFGRGGHSTRILDALSPSGTLLAFDRDPDAAEHAATVSSLDQRFSFAADNFSQLEQWVEPDSLSGVLLDLGVSSPQLDNPLRGFSFSHDGPLDMRMDTRQGQSAATWIAGASEREMVAVFRDLGEERFARRIASAIVREQAISPIETTGRLAEIVSAANPKWEQHKHPATRVFQAIRLHINGELESLQALLQSVVSRLSVGGRLVVISFHSLEDRLVKRFMRDASRGRQIPAGVPIRHQDSGASLRLIGKTIRPSASEVARNPRSRSAVMRVAEKIA